MAFRSSLALPAKSLWRRCFSHGGHGVHSPFAFELLTRVVEEKSLYSAFASIRGMAGANMTSDSLFYFTE